MSFERFAVGQSAALDHTVTSEDVTRFADLSGDTNPLHVDEAYATGLGVGGRIVHGMLTASYVSTVLGTLLPGAGTLWLSQSLVFRAPVRIGDHLHVTAIIRRISPSTRAIVLEVEVRNQLESVVLDGEVQVLVLDRLVRVNEPRAAAGTAVVTGASRGIGAVIAQRLASDGLPVVVNYNRSEAQAVVVAAAIRESGGQAIHLQADVTRDADVDNLMRRATEAFGPVEVLINNAGTAIDRRPLKDLSWNDIQRQIDAHLRSSVLCTQAALPSMVERGFGRIVNMTSQAGYGIPPPKVAGYAVAKAALAAWTRCLAQEGGPHGVTANAVAPGMVDTELVADVPQRAKLALAAQAPLRHLASASGIAEVMSFLVSAGASEVTGQTFHLSGGQVMQ